MCGRPVRSACCACKQQEACQTEPHGRRGGVWRVGSLPSTRRAGCRSERRAARLPVSSSAVKSRFSTRRMQRAKTARPTSPLRSTVGGRGQPAGPPPSPACPPHAHTASPPSLLSFEHAPALSAACLAPHSSRRGSPGRRTACAPALPAPPPPQTWRPGRRAPRRAAPPAPPAASAPARPVPQAEPGATPAAPAWDAVHVHEVGGCGGVV